jgi:hypothetical protein
MFTHGLSGNLFRSKNAPLYPLELADALHYSGSKQPGLHMYGKDLAVITASFRAKDNETKR